MTSKFMAALAGSVFIVCAFRYLCYYMYKQRKASQQRRRKYDHVEFNRKFNNRM